MDTWWCLKCNTHQVCLPCSEVRCGKGHKMKKLNTERELALARACEGTP